MSASSRARQIRPSGMWELGVISSRASSCVGFKLYSHESITLSTDKIGWLKNICYYGSGIFNDDSEEHDLPVFALWE
jgi:hypothetical protein